MGKLFNEIMPPNKCKRNDDIRKSSFSNHHLITETSKHSMDAQPLGKTIRA